MITRRPRKLARILLAFLIINGAYYSFIKTTGQQQLQQAKTSLASNHSQLMRLGILLAELKGLRADAPSFPLDYQELVAQLNQNQGSLSLVTPKLGLLPFQTDSSFNSTLSQHQTFNTKQAAWMEEVIKYQTATKHLYQYQPEAELGLDIAQFGPVVAQRAQSAADGLDMIHNQLSSRGNFSELLAELSQTQAVLRQLAQTANGSSVQAESFRQTAYGQFKTLRQKAFEEQLVLLSSPQATELESARLQLIDQYKRLIEKLDQSIVR